MSEAYRPSGVIEAEIEDLRAAAEAAGKKPSGLKLGKLRGELIDALKQENADLRACAEMGPVTAPDPDAGLEGFDQDLVDAEDPHKSDEWAFIEKSIAELQLNLTGGNMTDVAKKLYNQLRAKLRIWRIARDIVDQVGTGGDWPQWNMLNRNSSTGEVLPEKPAEPEPVAEPVAEAPVEGVTPGGMPIHAAAPSQNDILATVTGGDPRAAVQAQIEERSRPAERPVGAPA